MTCTFVSSIPNYLLDRQIQINDEHIHKISGFKVATASNYFKNLIQKLRKEEINAYRKRYEDSIKESTKPVLAVDEIDKQPIKIYYKDVYAIEFILTFIHATQNDDNLNQLFDKNINVSNFLSVLKASFYFDFWNIIPYCDSFIINKMNVNNCLLFHRIVSQMGEKMLHQILLVKDFILDNFLLISKTTHFMKLSIKELILFLNCNELNCSDEYVLFNAISTWILYDEDKRILHTPTLLKCLRLGKLSAENVYWLLDVPFVQKALKTNSELSSIIKHIKINLGMQDLSNNIPENLEVINDLKTPRFPRQAIFVVGGWEGNQDDPNFGPSRAIQVYDCRANLWKRYVTESFALDEGHAYSGCVSFDNKIYVVGGYVSTGPTQTMKMFDFSNNFLLPLNENLWTYLAPMHEKRNYVCVCHLRGLIYALGGHNGRFRLNTVERFDPKTNRWSYIPPMAQIRSDAGADTLNDRIYIVGGFDGHQFYSSVEMYNPDTNQWTLVSPMFNVRSGVSVVAHNNYLYAIGGNNGHRRLNTVERYDPYMNKWINMRPMNRQRSNFSVTVVENEVYVMGGWSDEFNSTVSLVEKWCPDQNSLWVSVTDLYMPASANCACTVFGLSNIKIYLGLEVSSQFKNNKSSLQTVQQLSLQEPILESIQPELVSTSTDQTPVTQQHVLSVHNLSESSNIPTTHQPITSQQSPTDLIQAAFSQSQNQQPLTTTQPLPSQSQNQQPSTALQPSSSQSQNQQSSTAFRPLSSQSQNQQPSTAFQPLSSQIQIQQPSTTMQPLSSQIQIQQPSTTMKPSSSQIQSQQPSTTMQPSSSQSQNQQPSVPAPSRSKSVQSTTNAKQYSQSQSQRQSVNQQQSQQQPSTSSQLQQPRSSVQSQPQRQSNQQQPNATHPQQRQSGRSSIQSQGIQLRTVQHPPRSSDTQVDNRSQPRSTGSRTQLDTPVKQPQTRN